MLAGRGVRVEGWGSGRRDKGMGEKSPPSDCMSKALDPVGSDPRIKDPEGWASSAVRKRVL